MELFQIKIELLSESIFLVVEKIVDLLIMKS